MTDRDGLLGAAIEEIERLRTALSAMCVANREGAVALLTGSRYHMISAIHSDYLEGAGERLRAAEKIARAALERAEDTASPLVPTEEPELTESLQVNSERS